MSNSNGAAVSGGMGCGGFLAVGMFLLFLGLKLGEVGIVAGWGWWWETSPLWIYAGLCLSLILIVLIIIIVVGICATIFGAD